MKERLTVLLMAACTLSSLAQIEDVIVETYYFTDSRDATDRDGGELEAGTTTYRVFVDLKPGSRILKIYGDMNHILSFSSTEPFFNHMNDGVSLGKDLNRSRYGNGTVALDTYLTLGQNSRTFSQGAYHGIPKNQDSDGSVIGGINNDGGSEQLPGGLLINSSPEVGLPLTVADGLRFSSQIPTGWVDIGFIDLSQSKDTTIFGSDQPKSSFSSNSALLRCSGVTGEDSIGNVVLIAQLTTKGQIAFRINLEVEIMQDGFPLIVRYVAQNENLGAHEVFEPLLSYPHDCGCTDPDFLEASTTYACSDNSKCITPVVLGCMDSLACNYDRNANFNLPDLCCYVGYCHDLDIGVVCPVLIPRDDVGRNSLKIFPNPVTFFLQLDVDFVYSADIPYIIMDLAGRQVNAGVLAGGTREMDTRDLDEGFYLISFGFSGMSITKSFLKI